MTGYEDVWITWTMNGWRVAYQSSVLPFRYDTQDEAIRFGTLLARHRRCDLFVEGEHCPIPPSYRPSQSQPNLENAVGRL